MRTPQTDNNPFALMVDPAAVLAKLEQSERLERLERHVCRPLDRPLLARADGTELPAFARELHGEAEPGGAFVSDDDNPTDA